MTYRKTWFDYVLWAAYAGVCVLLLAYAGNQIYTIYVGAPLAKLGAFLPFPVLFCLYPGIRLISQTIRKKYHFSVHTTAMMEAFAVSVSLVFGLLVRLREGLLHAAGYGAASAFGPGKYYELAVVRAGEESAALAHGLSDLYVRCLRVVFSFLGNSMMAAVLFQISLQLLAMLFAYLAVRKAAGRFSGCTVLLLLAFSDFYIGKIYVIDPECLFLLILLVGLFLVLCFVQAYLSGTSGFAMLSGSALLGVALGLFCYLEWGALILLLFLTGLFTGKRREDGGWKRLAESLLLVLAGVAVGFFVSIGVDASWSGIRFDQGLMSWAAPYFSVRVGARELGGVGASYLFLVSLLLPASFLVFAFIRAEREQDYSLWFLPCILVSPAFFVTFSIVGFSSAALFFWCVMASLGLKNTVFGGQAEALMEKIEEINASAEPIPAAEAMAAVPNPAAEPVAVTAVPAAVAEDSGKKPRFLENPLPLPKKHVKREMDYDYEVQEADLHYQVEIADGDDFDL